MSYRIGTMTSMSRDALAFPQRSILHHASWHAARATSWLPLAVTIGVIVGVAWAVPR